MALTALLLRPGELFIDGGANVGSFSLLASGIAGAQSIALEPVSATFRKLEANIELNRLNDRITALALGLGGTAGTAAITTQLGPSNQVIASKEPGSEQIQLTTLDALLEGRPTPTLIKIDVEGLELEVLAGATRTLARGVPAWLIESIDQSAVAQMATVMLAAGYHYAYYLPLTRSLSATRPAAKDCGGNHLWLRDPSWVEARLRSAERFEVYGVAL